MRRSLFIIGLTTISLLLTACGASKSFVSFEILEPASITYPKEVRKIAYLNRAPISMSSFARVNRRHMDELTLEILDTLVCNNLKKGFLEARDSSGLDYLEDVRELHSRRRDTIGKSKVMSTKFRENLFRDYSLDALVVLEFYEVLVDQSYSHYNPYLGEFVQEIMVSSRLLWRVYSEGEDKPVDEYLNHDTLFYMNRASKSSERFNATSTLANGCYEFGFNYGLRHIPEWKEVSRIIFRGSANELVKAGVHTDAGEWEKALPYWESLAANSEVPKEIAKAYNNLAVYHELSDDIDKAAEFIQLAEMHWDHQQITDYKAALDKRLIYHEDIKRQFRVEED